MIGSRVLPTRWPTFFLTLSAADTIWPDFLRACNPELTLEQCRHLPSKERRKLLSENPDIASRFFHHGFQSFFDNVLCGSSKPLGEIEDYFWRVEFQQRGSPHIHVLLWIQDAPDVLKLSETEDGRSTLAAFVDKHVSVLSNSLAELQSCTCEVCSVHRSENVDILTLRPPAPDTEDWKCDVSRLVQRAQQHVCYAGSSCRRKGNECRFGYPKDLQSSTEIDASIASDGTPSLKVKLKREVPTIHNYSPALLSSWRANMDIQLIGNAYGAAEYAGAYVSKAEPDTLRFRKVIASAVKRCDSNLPYQAILKIVANAALSIREVSAQEAYYILLRKLPMHGKSRAVVKIKVLRHNLRSYRVEPPRELKDLAALSNYSQSRTRIEPIERAYMDRPTSDPFQSMSFSAFVEKYEAVDTIGRLALNERCWTRSDGEGYIKLRCKGRVIRISPWIAPDSMNANFCFAEVFLHVPWRTLDDLPEFDEACVAVFFAEQERNLYNELRVESNAKISRREKLELLKQSSNLQCCIKLPPSEYVFVEEQQEQYDNISALSPSEAPPDNAPVREWNAKHAYSADDIIRAKDFIKTSVKPWMKARRDVFLQNAEKENAYRYPIVANGNTSDLVDSMAESQWFPYAVAMKQSRARLRAQLACSECDPLHLIINGEGGSGKSWLIEHIVKDTHCVFSEALQNPSQRALLLAHQGTAAFNIKGQTLCSAFGFASFSRSAFSVPYTSLTVQKNGPAKLKKLQQHFKDIHLVIIDEFSVISCGMLYWIDERMREVWPSHRHLRFGGRDVIFTGDAAQLDPVVPYSLSTLLYKVLDSAHRKSREIWEDIECVCMLTSQNRGKEDPEWFDALRRLRKRTPTAEDVALFNTRCEMSAGIPEEFRTAKHIAHKNVDVDAANEESIRAATAPIVHIKSQCHVQQKRIHRQREIPEGTVSALISEAKTANADRDRVVATNIKLCVGAPVTLTFNLEQSAGLCNGTNAIIYDFMFVSDSELPIVLIQVTDLYLGPSFIEGVPNIVPVPPKEISWGRKTSDFRTVRRGILLRLAYAMTIHKVQELKCNKVVFHSNSLPTIAFAYVALSRVRHRNDILLTQPLSLDSLKPSSDKLSSFRAEEARVTEAVAKTLVAALPDVAAMTIVASARNKSMLPRQ